MKTLLIRDGDLVLGHGGHETITGVAKVVQDLRMAIGEPLGNDRFHPGWGSRTNDYVGGAVEDGVVFSIRQEISRVVENYIAVQRDKIEADVLRGVRSRFGAGEVISDVQDIAVRQVEDRLLVTVRLRVLSGESIALPISVGV